MRIILLAIGLMVSITVFGQGSPDYTGGLKINLNEEGSKTLRFILWNQVWLRSTEMNPGTMIADEPTKSTMDIGNRRFRILAYAQISPRYMILTHVGINNQSFINGGVAGGGGTGGNGAGKKPGLFFHDAWNEYAIVLPQSERKFSMSVGAGLHYFMGLSRMTMGSTLNFMTIDAPIFNWPLIENSDQFARQIGLFTKGKYGKLEYRVSLNKPYATNLQAVDVPSAHLATAVDNNGNAQWSSAGYFEYQFLDSESNFIPFKVGTYVGTKRVFNIGAGFYNAPNSTRTSVNSIIEKHHINLLSLDLFLDMSVGDKAKKMAITAYSVFYRYDFGPNYLRNIGIMNIGVSDPVFKGQRALSGAGNAQATIGTGNIFYTQAGFLLPNQLDRPKVRIQPFTAYTYKDFQALDTGLSNYDFGANFFLDGHHSKITAQYSLRSLILNNGEKISRGEWIVQFQIFL